MKKKYINREISWLDFNKRVLDQAKNGNPLAEKLKFLAIATSNLDEFYRIRIAGLDLELDNLHSNDQSVLTDSLAKLLKVKAYAKDLVREIYQTNQVLLDELKKVGIQKVKFNKVNKEEKAYFKQKCLEIITNDLSINDLNREVLKSVSNNSLNLIGKTNDKYLLITYLNKERIIFNNNKTKFLLVDDVIPYIVDELFNLEGFEPILHFRILRNADLDLFDITPSNYLEIFKKELIKREMAKPIRLDIQPLSNDSLLPCLKETFSLKNEDIIIDQSTINLTFWFEFFNLDILDSKHYYPSQIPIELEEYSKENVFETVTIKDRLLYQPYHSYNSYINFLTSCVDNPNVLSIKQTFYRLCDNSQIIDLLKKASIAGKEVIVFIELRARFDELRNLNYYQELVQSGCNVIVYFDQKVHAKTTLVSYASEGKIKQVAHISTGNYNKDTAKIYSDLTFFTTDEIICSDLEKVFLYLSNGKELNFNKLIVSPIKLRETFINLIKEEIDNAKNNKKGLIIAKMNSLVDQEIIDLLYQASISGVEIKLIVRGICSLNTSFKMAKNIEVISIVGRYLEHARIYYFHNSNNPRYFISSADWMSRNLDRRVEIAVEVTDEDNKNFLFNILQLNLADDVKARKMLGPSKYTKPDISGNVNSQDLLYEKYYKENKK